jgi:hypothetical protein
MSKLMPPRFPSRSATWPRARTLSKLPINIFAVPDEISLRRYPAEFSAFLDDRDRFVSASASWDTSGPTDCPWHRVLGNSIHTFIADRTTGDCFQLLLDQVRAQHRTVQIAARCDHRWHPRAMQLTFNPSSSGEIEIRWNLIGGPPAREIARVSRRRFNNGEHLRMCSWCKDVRLGECWLDLETAAPMLGLMHQCRLPPITHGICRECSPALTENIATHSHDQVPVNA